VSIFQWKPSLLYSLTKPPSGNVNIVKMDTTGTPLINSVNHVLKSMTVLDVSLNICHIAHLLLSVLNVETINYYNITGWNVLNSLMTVLYHLLSRLKDYLGMLKESTTVESVTTTNGIM